MTEHGAEFISSQLATTVAYLLDTSVDHAEQLIDTLLRLPETDPGRVALVVDLILARQDLWTAGDEVVLPKQG